jgi:hypothetical protein
MPEQSAPAFLSLGKDSETALPYIRTLSRWILPVTPGSGFGGKPVEFAAEGRAHSDRSASTALTLAARAAGTAEASTAAIRITVADRAKASMLG